MQILYHSKTDLLYLRLDERQQSVMNRRVSDEAVLDLGEGDKIVGIEIMAASTRLDLRYRAASSCPNASVGHPG